MQAGTLKYSLVKKSLSTLTRFLLNLWKTLQSQADHSQCPLVMSSQPLPGHHGPHSPFEQLLLLLELQSHVLSTSARAAQWPSCLLSGDSCGTATSQVFALIQQLDLTRKIRSHVLGASSIGIQEISISEYGIFKKQAKAFKILKMHLSQTGNFIWSFYWKKKNTLTYPFLISYSCSPKLGLKIIWIFYRILFWIKHWKAP